MVHNRDFAVKSKNSLISVVLLTRNEETTIQRILSEIQQSLIDLPVTTQEILLADDSTDQTPKIALQEGIRVVSCGQIGLGHAYLMGVKSALEGRPDFILTLDSDGQTDLREIKKFLDALIEEDADLIVASRFRNQDMIQYPYPKFNRFGVRLLSTYLTIATWQRFTDSHGGIRLMRREVAESLALWGRHTYVQESIVHAVINGFKVIELPSRWLKREHGESRVLASIYRYVRRTAPVLAARLLQIYLWRLMHLPKRRRDLAA